MYAIKRETLGFVEGELNSCFPEERRYSSLLAKQLAVAYEARTINVFEIFEQISFLEGGSARAMPTKNEDQFKYFPLKGLWKKHFFQAPFLVKNLANQMKQGDYFNQVMKQFPPGSLMSDIIPKMVYDIVMGGYQQKASEHSLTGEWIVFAKYKEKNYYLTLGAHGDDALIRNLVDQTLSDFPFLKEILP